LTYNLVRAFVREEGSIARLPPFSLYHPLSLQEPLAGEGEGKGHNISTGQKGERLLPLLSRRAQSPHKAKGTRACTPFKGMEGPQ